ncbi:hypothetical protein L6452_45048 [Arctium lappa]|nr:hypothetical protein L6452_45048 [Arctium lappa]
MSRRARRSLQNLGREPAGAAVGADLGGSSKYSNENFEGPKRGKPAHPGIDSVGGRVQRLEEHRTSRGVRQGKSANGSVTSGKGLALRAGHGGPSPEPVAVGGLLELLPRRERVAACRPGDGLGTASSGAFPGRRTANSELSESGLEATRVPAACLPTSSRGLGPQRHVSLAKLVRRTSRAGRLEVQFPSSGG